MQKFFKNLTNSSCPQEQIANNWKMIDVCLECQHPHVQTFTIRAIAMREMTESALCQVPHVALPSFTLPPKNEITSLSGEFIGFILFPTGPPVWRE